MILQHNDVNTQSATKEARNTQPGTCEGSHLVRSQSRPSNAIIHTILLLLLLLPHQNASRNARRASELSSHSLFGTLAPSQPSRSHPRNPPARNSALLLISSPALLIGGFVFSWGRPGSDRGISANKTSTIKQAGARCLPLLEPSVRVASSLLSGSRPQ